MNQSYNFFLIAGEASGDLLGADLMAGLRESTEGHISFSGVGGPLMQAQGLQPLFPMSDLSVMGLIEVLPKAPKLLYRVAQTAKAAIAAQPDALITIDSPDFSMRVAAKYKAAFPDAKTIHYVAPSVWAWRPERAEKMARHIDHVLALLPFEPAYMQKVGMSCDFVGHPVVADPLPTQAEQSAVLADLGINPAKDQLVTILPGSRRGEVTRLSDIFGQTLARVAEAVPEAKFVLAAAGNVVAQVQDKIAAWPVQPILLDPREADPAQNEARKRCLFAASRAALAASGTVSLELAAMGCPMVIAYKANPVTTHIVKKMALTDTATLVNILTQTREIPELLFENCRAEKIAPAVIALLRNEQKRRDQKIICEQAMQLLGKGQPDAGTRAARSVLEFIG